MTPEEFKTKQASTSGKWIKEPGTYSMSIISIEEKGASQFDGAWLDFVIGMENADGAKFNTFISVPTTAERSFLFGKKKSLNEYNRLEKFLGGLGIALEYSSAISTIADIFEDPTSLVGRTLTLRLGFYTNYVKYIGKDGDLVQYQIVDKNASPLDPTVFNNFDAAKAFAKEKNIKLQDFIKILDIVPAAVSNIVVGASTSELPF